MSTKLKRLDVLRRLIASNKAGSQEDILLMLAENGFNVTQATLSRDLKALKVAKIPDGHGGYHYILPESITGQEPVPISGNASGHIISSIKSIEFSGQMGVIRTRPGYANMIASILDSSIGSGLMGTVAGDDTVLLILRQGADSAELLADLEKVIPGISVRRI